MTTFSAQCRILLAMFIFILNPFTLNTALANNTAAPQQQAVPGLTNLPRATTVVPRARIIIDNDFGGDPDGLFQLAHHLLSPSVSVVGVIASKHYPSGFYGDPGTAAFASEQARTLLDLLNTDIPLYSGAEIALENTRSPQVNAASQFIVREAMRDDSDLPLYVVCGAGLGSVASAYLMEPKIAARLQLIWIGGPEYQGTAAPPDTQGAEYNLGIDIAAAQVVFNNSRLALWQVPRNTYRQTLVSHSELLQRLNTQGPLAEFLIGRLESLFNKAQGNLGEVYALGDSPLVLLSALQSAWQPAASSSFYLDLPAPKITAAGDYLSQSKTRKIRVYFQLDNRLMLEDFYAKVRRFDSDPSHNRSELSGHPQR